MTTLTRRRAVTAGIAAIGGAWLPSCGEGGGERVVLAGATCGDAGVPSGGNPFAMPGSDIDAIVESLFQEPADAFVPLKRWLEEGVDVADRGF